MRCIGRIPVGALHSCCPSVFIPLHHLHAFHATDVLFIYMYFIPYLYLLSSTTVPVQTIPFMYIHSFHAPATVAGNPCNSALPAGHFAGPHALCWLLCLPHALCRPLENLHSPVRKILFIFANLVWYVKRPYCSCIPQANWQKSHFFRSIYRLNYWYT